jgi:hypothetical protein
VLGDRFRDIKMDILYYNILNFYRKFWQVEKYTNSNDLCDKHIYLQFIEIDKLYDQTVTVKIII